MCLTAQFCGVLCNFQNFSENNQFCLLVTMHGLSLSFYQRGNKDEKRADERLFKLKRGREK